MQQQDVEARVMHGEDIEILPSPLLLEEMEKTFLGSRLVLVPLAYGLGQHGSSPPPQFCCSSTASLLLVPSSSYQRRNHCRDTPVPDVLAGASNPLPEGHAEVFPDLMVRTGASASFPVGLIDTIPLHLTSSTLLLTSTCPPSPTSKISTRL
ncbi:hypothetical protein ILYODFUR_032654 [Ilyodon furcidens]|uniref:Uncharacterized protein n=1 Tax=Ilyodon furcidens TaxID=33524 RepID=A0ABV0TCZ9_9TELE